MTDVVDVSGKKDGGMTTKLGGAYGQYQKVMAEPGVRRALPMIFATLVVVGGLVMYMFLQTPTYTTLYASLPEAEKAKVLESLKNSGIDVVLDPATGDVTVPVDDYHAARLGLAAQGLPESVPDGYNVLGDMPMGTSRSVENMRLKQSQEMELARSINEIDIVRASRVHLAIPEKSAFARNSQPPSASVFVQLAQGRSLSAEQVSAIVNLVSSAVPNMPKSGVSIIDQNGRLLSDAGMDPATDLTQKQMQYRMSLENVLRNRVISLLTPVVGLGNVSAQVSLDLDFTRQEMTEDTVIPESSVLLSERNIEEERSEPPAVGVPGAVSNTPPPQADLTNPADAAPNQNAQDNAGEGGAPAGQVTTPAGPSEAKTRSSERTRNFDFSRRVMRQEAAYGTVKRLNIAVLLREVDQVALAEAGGNADISAAELEQQAEKRKEAMRELEMLVRSAVGFNEARGDTITIASRPFTDVMIDGVEPAWYEDGWIADAVQHLLMLMAMAVIVLGIIRPMIAKTFAQDTSTAVAIGENGELVDDPEALDTIQVEPGQSLEDIKAKLKPKKQTISAEMLDTANSYEDKVALIRMIVSDEAGRVTNVFKSMMADEINR